MPKNKEGKGPDHKKKSSKSDSKKSSKSSKSSSSNSKSAKEGRDEAMREQIKELQNQLSKLKGEKADSSGESPVDPDEFERTAPEGARLRCYEDSPIIETKLIEEEGKDENGEIVVVETKCELKTLDGQEATIPYGSTSKDDYLNLPKKEFPFVDAIDETGASRIKKEKVEDLGSVRRRDPSNIVSQNGEEQNDGQLVKQLVKKNVRYYTIEVDGEKHEIHQDVLSK